MPDRLSTLDDIRALTPGARFEVECKLETLIESAFTVERQRPNILPGVGGGALYTLKDLADGEVADAFRAVEEKFPNHRVVYDDMAHAWYATISVEQNNSITNFMIGMCDH